MTPDREKYLRARIEAEESIGWTGVKELLSEIDRLREIIRKLEEQNPWNHMGEEYEPNQKTEKE